MEVTEACIINFHCIILHLYRVQINTSMSTFRKSFTPHIDILSFLLISRVTDELGISTTLSTKIKVEDDNDNAPIFEGDSKASLLESSPKG